MSNIKYDPDLLNLFVDTALLSNGHITIRLQEKINPFSLSKSIRDVTRKRVLDIIVLVANNRTEVKIGRKETEVVATDISDRRLKTRSDLFVNAWWDYLNPITPVPEKLVYRDTGAI